VSVVSGSYWTELPLGPGVELLVHDQNGLAAFNKPAGVLSHPNEAGDEPRSTLMASYVLDGEYFEWTTPAASQRLWLLNRLDSATSGVILAAADGELAAAIKAQFKRKQVRKIYQALVFGAPRQPLEVWRDVLVVEKHGGKIRTTTGSGHVPAESRMTVVRTGRQESKVTLLRLEPRTGRSHQLRVQCAKRNLPIVGDQTYGDFARNRAFAKTAGSKRMFLHSMETSFEYNYGGRSIMFSAHAALPTEFLRAL
jgi:23S rRNA-/tRNA-specific pseudouridylate synthase